MMVTWWVAGFLLALHRGPSTTSKHLVSSARIALGNNDTDLAYSLLTDAYRMDSQTPGLLLCFEDMFRVKIKLFSSSVDRMGLASLLSDQGKYEQSAKELRILTEDKSLPPTLQEKASSMLFRTNAAICCWDNHYEDGQNLAKAVRNCIDATSLPAVHPFEALMWPSLSLQDTTSIASLYAMRATEDTSMDPSYYDRVDWSRYRHPATFWDQHTAPSIRISKRSTEPRQRKKKLGYISPDFTGKHPLAFLMQDVFRFHDTSDFEIYIYSFSECDGSVEVEKIEKAASHWKVLPSSNLDDITSTIIADKLDILIDLCGYTGSSVVASVMAHRVAPIQIGYMGYPASSGAPFMDYMICDSIVVPSFCREHYSENLVVMPHCYFVNSHAFLQTDSTTKCVTRDASGLPNDAFVFCCHSRPDKLDPFTFRSWLRVLKKVRDDGDGNKNARLANAVLWLLKSGEEMENRIREIAKNEFDLTEDSLVFAEKAPRDEHLQRLSLADVFLDTPAYNAHTVGCDSLHAGVPMISLLRPPEASVVEQEEGDAIATEKLGSRVGASLLTSVGLGELIAENMPDYERIMAKCAFDDEWFSALTKRLHQNRATCPLFDTARWVKNLEMGLDVLESANSAEDLLRDVYIIDNE